jgi:hypothetical protein
MLQTISSPRREAASPPHQDVAMRKRCYTLYLAVDSRGPQIHAVPCSFTRSPRLVTCGRHFDTIGHAEAIRRPKFASNCVAASTTGHAGTIPRWNTPGFRFDYGLQVAELHFSSLRSLPGNSWARSSVYRTMSIQPPTLGLSK